MPVHLAYCGVAAALRRHVATKGSSLAVLAVANSEAIDTYVYAARLLLRQAIGNRDYPEPFVKSLSNKKKDNPTDLHLFRRAAENGKGIILCSDIREVDEELKFFADIVADIPAPSARQIAATFRRFGHVISKTDQALIGSETWTRLVYAFQPDRPILAGLRRLRESAQRSSADAVEKPATGPTLNEVHGFGDAQRWGLELARDIEDYRQGLVSWDEVDAGLLISGPPGTGKTFFAEALANTCRVPIVARSAAQWQSAGYLNDFLREMRSAFSEAASKAPSLLFIDELDSFGNRAVTDSQNGDYKRQIINGFIECLDGFQRRTGVVVIGATNHPEHLDPAIVRSGRLDRHIPISLPDAETRLHIFAAHAGFSVSSGEATKFIRSTVGMSGADIKKMVREAKRAARRANEPLQISHALTAARPLTSVPMEYQRLTAVHETGHSIVGVMLGLKFEGVSISEEIVSDGPTLVGGAVFSGDPFTPRTKGYCFKQLSMMLGGIAAEKILYDEFDGGLIDSYSDLSKATALATQMEACFGFGDTLLVEVVGENQLSRLRASSPELRSAVKKLLDDALENAISMLNENIASLHVIADALERHRYLSETFVKGILNGHRAKSGDPLGYDTADPQYPLQVASDALSGLNEDEVQNEIDNAMRRWGAPS